VDWRDRRDHVRDVAIYGSFGATRAGVPHVQCRICSGDTRRHTSSDFSHHHLAGADAGNPYGTGLAFARAIGEYGSVVFISNNLPYHSEVASSYIYSLAVSDQTNSAASVAVALLIIALVLLIFFNVTAQRLARHRA